MSKETKTQAAEVPEIIGHHMGRVQKEVFWLSWEMKDTLNLSQFTVNLMAPY